MSLTLHYHPLASFCWKVLIGLYENETPFTPVIVDLGDPASRGAFQALWPLGKMPVLEDAGRGEVVAESSVILDYLDAHHSGPVRFTPQEDAWRVRLWDRIFDLHLHQAMQKVVTDRIRPQGQGDPFGVSEARSQIRAAYGVIEKGLAGRDWLSAGGFGLAECAAAPALYYADRVEPLGAERPLAAAYLERLKARPSFARVLAEAEPYFKYFPVD